MPASTRGGTPSIERLAPRSSLACVLGAVAEEEPAGREALGAEGSVADTRQLTHESARPAWMHRRHGLSFSHRTRAPVSRSTRLTFSPRTPTTSPLFPRVSMTHELSFGSRSSDAGAFECAWRSFSTRRRESAGAADSGARSYAATGEGGRRFCPTRGIPKSARYATSREERFNEGARSSHEPRSATRAVSATREVFTENPNGGGPYPPARGGGKSYARPAPPLSRRNVQSSASRTASTSPTRGGGGPAPAAAAAAQLSTYASHSRGDGAELESAPSSVARSVTRPLRSKRRITGSALAPAPAPESAAPPANSAISQRSPAWALDPTPTRTIAPRAACSASTATRGSYEFLRDAKCTASAPTGAGPRSSAKHRRDTSARVANIASASSSVAGDARSGKRVVVAVIAVIADG